VEAAFHALDAWQIEVYHRGLKQFTGIERGQYRLEVSQRNHIGLAIRAFVRLEVYRLQTGIPGLKPRQVLFAPPCDCIWLIRPSLSFNCVSPMYIRQGQKSTHFFDIEDILIQRSCPFVFFPPQGLAKRLYPLQMGAVSHFMNENADSWPDQLSRN